MNSTPQLPGLEDLGRLSESFALLDAAYRDDADISLYGDNLAAWKHAVAEVRSREALLGAGQIVARAAVLLSSPFWLLATLFSTVIGVLSVYAGGWPARLLRPLHWLLARPAMMLVVVLERSWLRLPGLRPSLLLVALPLLPLAMVSGALVPASSEARTNKQMLCELWPLGERRLYWLQRYGNQEVRDRGSTRG